MSAFSNARMGTPPLGRPRRVVRPQILDRLINRAVPR
jgi:hypothetical protein